MKAKTWVQVLVAGIGVLSLQMSSHAASLSGVARNADGSVQHMNQFYAQNYCRDQGQRLPTARELGVYAQSLGAAGISETAKDGYDSVSGSDPDGQPDNFYFSNAGYQRPSGDLGDLWFWSSSASPSLPVVAYILVGAYGNFYVAQRGANDAGAVICAH